MFRIEDRHLHTYGRAVTTYVPALTQPLVRQRLGESCGRLLLLAAMARRCRECSPSIGDTEKRWFMRIPRQRC